MVRGIYRFCLNCGADIEKRYDRLAFEGFCSEICEYLFKNRGSDSRRGELHRDADARRGEA